MAKGQTKNTPARAPAQKLRRDASTAWLERTNPLANLSIASALAIWDCARGGDTQRLHWLFQEIEAANPVLMTCVERRNAALSGYAPKVAVQPAADQSLGDEQKDALERFLSGIENLSDALEHLGLAFFRGFAFAQPIWEADGTVREIALPDSWEFLMHGGALWHNPRLDGFNRNCVDCRHARLVGVRRRRAIDYPALSIHIRQAVGDRDWGRFLERYALPKPAVIMPPTATNEHRDDFLVGARAVENGQVSVWPNATNITDFAGGSRGTDPFSAFITHQEKLLVLMATGGTLTSLAEAGSGTLAGHAQMEVWREIVARDAFVIASALMRDMARPFLEAAFPGRPCAVDLSLAAETVRTPKESAELAAILKTAGFSIDQSELEKAVGFTLVKDETPAAPAPFAPLRNASPRPVPKASGVLAAFAEDSGPAAARVKELLADPTPEAARRLLADLPSLLPDDPALAAVLAEEMAKEFGKVKPPADSADDADLTQEEADEIYEEMMGL